MSALIVVLMLGQVAQAAQAGGGIQPMAGCVEGAYSACTLANCAIAVKECVGGKLTPCYCLVQSCNDGNPCTADSKSGFVCVNAPQTGTACNDGNVCTWNDRCSAAGQCAGTIGDGNACTTDTCTATGPVFTWVASTTCPPTATLFCHDKYGNVTRKAVCTHNQVCESTCP